jgi:hypothetical protein
MTLLSPQFVTNPDKQNAAQPIPISVIVQPAGQTSAVSATASTQAPIPGAGLTTVKVVQTTSGGFVDVAAPTFVDAPVQTTVPLTSVAQASEGGVASSEATNTDERLVFLRIVSPAGLEGTPIPVPEGELNNLPGLFQKLPDGHYKVYLSEEGHERLVIEVVVRQGRAVDPTNDSGGQDRPPTSQIDSGRPDPVATSEMQSRHDGKSGDNRTVLNDLPPFRDDGSLNASNDPDQTATTTAAIAPVQGSPIKPTVNVPSTKRPAANLQRPALDVGPVKNPSANTTDKNGWGAALSAAGAAVGVGAGLSREERVDQAMQQLDSRSLSKAARLARCLRKSK